MRVLEKLLKTYASRTLALDATVRFADFDPHLIYANLNFRTEVETENAQRLFAWCGVYGPDWSQTRVIKYLRAHQTQFRDCLHWLVRDALVDYENAFSRKVEEWELETDWRREPELRFLERHCLTHAEIHLKPQFGPAETGAAFFAGLSLGQGKTRDPLDPVCWHLLHVLMRDGVLALRECKRKECENFFRTETARREYCSDLCRSKDHAPSKKKNREYMRKYRKRKEEERRKRARLKTLTERGLPLR
jgi:hypothetical protein